MHPRVSADVHFVNYGHIPRNLTATTLSCPVEVTIDYGTFRHEGRTVSFVERRVVPGLHLITKKRRIPCEATHVRKGMGIEQELVRIESVSSGRFIRAVHSKAIRRARPNVE